MKQILEAINYENMISNLDTKMKGVRKTIGILISQPNSEFVKSEVINRINYYYHRSSNYIDFYLPGYGAYWPENMYNDAKSICKVNDTTWLYSTIAFVEFIRKLESMSKYRYSGETELIILDYANGCLDYNNALIFWLDRMVKDDAIYSVPNFFENLFKLFEAKKGIVSASDSLAINSIVHSLLDNFKISLPFNLGTTYQRTAYFCTRSLN